MKKLSIFVLVLVLALATTAFAASFSDVPADAWYASSVNRLAGENVINGFEDGTFKGNDYLTKAQFTSSTVRLFGVEEKRDISGYSDVKSGDWFYEDMQKGFALGLLQVSSSKSLRPNAYINREDSVDGLNNVFGLTKGSGDKDARDFADYDEITTSCLDAVSAFVTRGLIVGFPDNTFKATNILTRAQYSVLLDRAFKLIITKSGEYDAEGTDKIVLVKAKDVTLKNAENAIVIFLNNECKDSCKGLSADKLAKAPVVNGSQAKEEKQVKTSGGGTGTSTPVIVLTEKERGFDISGNKNVAKNKTIKVRVKLLDGKSHEFKISKVKTYDEAVTAIQDVYAFIQDQDIEDLQTKLSNTIELYKDVDEVKEFAKEAGYDKDNGPDADQVLAAVVDYLTDGEKLDNLVNAIRGISPIKASNIPEVQ